MPGRMYKYKCGLEVVLVLGVLPAEAGIPDSDCVDVFVLALHDCGGCLKRWFVYRSGWLEVGR